MREVEVERAVLLDLRFENNLSKEAEVAAAFLDETKCPGAHRLSEDNKPQLRIRLEALACERDGGLARPESVGDEAGQDMDHGVDHRPVA